MSERFTKRWESKKSKVKYEGPKGPQPLHLKPRLEQAVKRMELQISKLEQTSGRFSQKDKALFSKIVDSYTKHDTARANIYATELAEIRKMNQTVINARLALDQVVLRMKTVTELGDIVTTLGPVIGILRSVNGGIGGVLPEAENELCDIGNMLSGIMFDAGTNTEMGLNFSANNEEATQILSEAATIAEQRVNANFPDLPSGLTSNPDKTKT
ncbi:MAG: Snf7 family protein [Candidatus Bathyarchaeota archaeon]|nr:Snf7 family protein [Candidatus Bathyarchaeota archaeon]